MNWIEKIKNYSPYNNQEQNDKEIILDYINKFDNTLTRDNKVAHITSSAFVVNKTRDKVLMIYHNIYKSWSWTGGHADGEPNLLEVSIKELKEETGVKNIKIINKDIFSIDILPVFGHIKRGEYVSAHLHLSIAYLLEVDENDPLVVKEDENSGVKWIPIDMIDKYNNEKEMQKVYDKLVDKTSKELF